MFTSRYDVEAKDQLQPNEMESDYREIDRNYDDYVSFEEFFSFLFPTHADALVRSAVPAQLPLPFLAPFISHLFVLFSYFSFGFVFVRL